MLHLHSGELCKRMKIKTCSVFLAYYNLTSYFIQLSNTGVANEVAKHMC